MEVKHLIEALEGPHIRASALKGSSRGPKWLKITMKEKKYEKLTKSSMKVLLLTDSTP